MLLPAQAVARLHHSLAFTAFTLLVVQALTGCGGDSPTQTARLIETLPPNGVSSAALTPEATSEDITPTPEAIPTQTPRLRLWWPEPLAPTDNENAADALSVQISDFQAANDEVQVEFRLKQVDDIGGIMSTLRTASAVAPGVIPDLTLLRRDDLLVAVQAGLIQPMGDRLSGAILNNLPDAALRLGQYRGQVYGLPYTLDVQHLAYLPTLTAPANWRFDDLLTQQFHFVFPVGRTNKLSDVFLVQYLSAGGSVSEDGSIIINEDALRAVFNFYQQAIANGLIDPKVTTYETSDDYSSDLADGSINAGIVTSTVYLNLLSSHQDMAFAPIPTLSGDQATPLDGWMWVLTTADADRQALALRFLTWMLDPDRQGAYSRLIHMLPSQRTALRSWDNTAYTDFVTSLLSNATLPPSESESGTAAQVIQNGLVAVIQGQRTAAQATQDVINQLAG